MVPFFFFKAPLTKITNQNLQKTINQLKQAPSAEAATKQALEILKAKYDSGTVRTYFFFWMATQSDPNVLWDRKGFMHCTQQNHLLRLLLVKSEQVEERDIRLGYSLIWYISIHQYLKITLEKDRTVGVDPWSYGRGAKWNEFASGFTLKSISS